MAMTRGRKILVGCLVAVAAVVLAVVLVVVMFFSWLSSPGPDLEGERLVDADTRLYTSLRLRRDDPDVRDLVRLFILEKQQGQMQVVDADELPPILRQLIPMLQNLGSGEVADKDLDKALPLALYATTSRGSQGEDLPLLAVNFPSSGHTLKLIDWILARAVSDQPDFHVSRLGDETLYMIEPDQQVWFSIVDTDVILSTTESGLTSGIQRLSPLPAAAAAPAPLASLLLGIPEDTDFRFVAIESGISSLPQLFLDVAPGLSEILRRHFSAADSVTAWGRLESPDRMAGEIYLRYLEDASADAATGPGSRFTLEFLDGTFRLVLDDRGRVSSGQHRWQFSLEGLEALTRRTARNLGGGTIIIP